MVLLYPRAIDRSGIDAVSSPTMASTRPAGNPSHDEKETSSQDHLGDAAEVATGAGVVFGAEIGGRALRLATTWYLSGALGAAAFGRWSSAVTVLIVVSALVPLGLDMGVVYFGARYRGRGERAELKGLLRMSTVLVACTATLAVLSCSWLCAGWLANQRPDLAADLAMLGPAVGVYGLLLFLVGVLRALKDMRAQAISFQLALPAATLLGVIVALQLDLGLRGVLMAFTLAVFAATLLAGWQCLRRVGAMLRDRQLKAVTETRKILAWSLPQSLESTLFRTNQWMDVLMLTALAAPMLVGTYRVALAIALLCTLPVMALVTMFNPVVADLLGRGETRRLELLLATVTRWLLALSAPVFLAVVLVPDLLLWVFDEAYLAGAPALRTLAVGMAVVAAATPTLRLIPMAGFAKLNLFNHAWVVLLNGGLNLWLIPWLGMEGAALATTTSLVLWSAVIVLQVRRLLGCSAWDRGNVRLAVMAALLGSTAFLLTSDASLPVRLAALALAIALHVGVVKVWILGEDDRRTVNLLRKRFRRRTDETRGTNHA